VPEGWGARNPGAPTSQHHKRHGCSRRTFAQKKLRIGAHDAREKSARKGEIGTRVESFHWNASKGTIVSGFRLFRSRARTVS
jgi:hypothetical protein